MQYHTIIYSFLPITLYIAKRPTSQALTPSNIPIQHIQSSRIKRKKEASKPPKSSGSRIRTYDLWVMSPTSYLCSIPRC